MVMLAGRETMIKPLQGNKIGAALCSPWGSPNMPPTGRLHILQVCQAAVAAAAAAIRNSAHNFGRAPYVSTPTIHSTHQNDLNSQSCLVKMMATKRQSWCYSAAHNFIRHVVSCQDNFCTGTRSMFDSISCKALPNAAPDVHPI